MSLANSPVKDLVPIKKAAIGTDITPAHLRRLVRDGRIVGIKLGQSWYTTVEAVQAYLAEGHRPGPKPHGRAEFGES